MKLLIKFLLATVFLTAVYIEVNKRLYCEPITFTPTITVTNPQPKSTKPNTRKHDF